MERWQGKIAVVTGASAGIGAAISKKLVEEGINVVGFARRKERIEEFAKTLTGKNNAKLQGLQVDITKEDEVVNAFEYIAKNIGPVSILVNNAGIVQLTTLIGGDATKWKKVLDTNVFGLCVATREAVKSMMENNIDGHIVHINSVAGHRVSTIPYTNVYSASKFAVTALARTLINELRTRRSKIKVSSVSPGYVETEICEVNGFMDTEEMRELEKNAPRMYPIDIANAVAYVIGTPPHVEVAELTVQPISEDV